MTPKMNARFRLAVLSPAVHPARTAATVTGVSIRSLAVDAAVAGDVAAHAEHVVRRIDGMKRLGPLQRGSKKAPQFKRAVAELT